MDQNEVWQAALGELEVIFSQANFATWFKDTFILELSPKEITIGVPNAFTKEWLENKYHKEVFDALKKSQPNLANVTYTIATRLAQPISEKTDWTNRQDIPKNEPTKIKPKIVDQIPSHLTLNPRYTFETFITSNSNRLAFATAQAVAKKPGEAYNPLFIYGGVGLGKTHLTQAIGNEIFNKSPKKKIVYASCEKFTNDYIGSISNKKTNEFKKNYRDADVLIIDDIQFMSGKEGTQEEFFHTFNALHQANRQIIITSDRVPKAIPQMTDRLSSRFGMGMVADIQPPNLEMRQAILRAKCAEKNYLLDDHVIDYIAQNIESNIRELEGAINRVLSFADLNGMTPSLDIATKALQDIIESKNSNLTAEKVLAITATYFDLTPEDILSPRRNKELIKPRQIVMYLMRHEMNLSYPKISQKLNKKDHTTIIWGVEKIEKAMASNEDLHRELSQIKEKLHSFD